MASNEVRRPGGISVRGLYLLANSRSYWRWRYIVLDKHSMSAN